MMFFDPDEAPILDFASAECVETRFSYEALGLYAVHMALMFHVDPIGPQRSAIDYNTELVRLCTRYNRLHPYQHVSARVHGFTFEDRVVVVKTYSVTRLPDSFVFIEQAGAEIGLLGQVPAEKAVDFAIKRLHPGGFPLVTVIGFEGAAPVLAMPSTDFAEVKYTLV